MRIARPATVAALCLAVRGAPADEVFLRAERVASGLSRPVFVCAAPGDLSRLFVLEQSTGRVRLVRDGVVQAAPFLDLGALVNTTGGERGLLGLAFHPDYAVNGRFFVHYNDPSGRTVIARYNVSGDPDAADPDSAQIVLTHSQPFINHNGGMLAFGPDGYLYVALGDGGGVGDPESRAQDRGVLLGKLLRIDVDGGAPYAIPPDNPFVDMAGARGEIWALGLRNPWRFSFDRLTGDLYIGDVGQETVEEIDFQPASSAGGENYGWRLMEGNICYNPPTSCDPGGLAAPIHVYEHDDGCAVIGGYVYRGSAIAGLGGTYFFGDLCRGRVWSLRYAGGQVTEFRERTAELAVGIASPINVISSFGEDAAGELYICDIDGDVFRIVGDDRPDCDGDGIPDVVALAQGMAQDCNLNGTPDNCEAQADLNGNGRVDLLDFLTFSICFGLRAPVPGECDSALFAQCDFAPDGVINLTDFTRFAVYLGACAPGERRNEQGEPGSGAPRS